MGQRCGGIDGHPLDVIAYDTEGDEEKAALSLKNLAEEDGVVAAIGSSQYDVSLSLIQL